MMIGAHVSAAGGVFHAVERARFLGVDAIQIFGSSPRSWKGKEPSADDVQQFRTVRAASPLRAVFLHAPYLVNFASKNPFNRKHSIASAVFHLTIAEAIGADGLVVHIGSGNGSPRDEAMTRVADAVRAVLTAVPGKARLLLENGSGGGDKVGAMPEEIGAIIRAVRGKRVGACLDTAHAFESGALCAFTKKGISDFFDRWEKVVGMDRLFVLHANDSMTAAGSLHDRHANIGEGQIGLAGFRALAREPRVRDLPWILEVPGFDGDGPDKKNVEILRGCF